MFGSLKIAASRRSPRTRRPGTTFRPRLNMLEDRALLSVTMMVSDPGDSGTGTLRDAIENSAPGDVINFDAGMAGATIQLQSPLLVDHALTIEGLTKPGGDPYIKIDGGNATRIFEVISDGDVTLANLELNNGLVIPGQPLLGGGPAAYADHLGGAAVDFCTYGGASLTINNVFFVNNNVDGKLSGADATGGAIDFRSATGTLTIDQSRFYDNMALGGMGAMGAAGTGADGAVGGSAYGGAVYATGADVNIHTTMFVCNQVVGGMGGWGGSNAGATGGDGGDGGSAYGGAVYVNGPGEASIVGMNVFHYNNASSGWGGRGGDGAIGGDGGHGGNASGGGIAFGHQTGAIDLSIADLQWNYCVGSEGGLCGMGAVPAQDGVGGNGGDSNGGAIFCLGDNGFVMDQLQFNGNSVRAGNGALGGIAGGVGGDSGGAAIYVQCVMPGDTISHCNINYGSAYCGAGGYCNSTATNEVTGKGVGGALLNDSATAVTIHDVNYVGNWTTDGDYDVCGACIVVP